MKSFSILISLAYLAVATPLIYDGYDQASFSADGSYPGFDLDLTARRLVQLEGQPPVWMTELEKVLSIIHLIYMCMFEYIIIQIQAKARGVKFFDM